MKKKINLLILASILGLIALSIIQGYLINNTYKLKKDAFISETKRSVLRLDDFSAPLDSLNNIWQDKFLETLVDYKAKTVTKTEVINRLQHVIHTINEPFKQEYQNELRKNNIPHGIKFHNKVRTIVLIDSLKNDTIFNFNKTPRLIVLGDAISKENALSVNTNLWQSEHTSVREVDGENVKSTLYLMFYTEGVMGIDNWKTVIFKQMIGLLTLSLFIFSFVIALLYFSIKNLITQKNIAEVKTDFVNNITHELKTPLATLSLATSILKNPKVKQDPQRFEATINTIERQNKRLQKLIDQVLNNSLGYKEIQLHKESVHIESYLHTVLDDFLLTVASENVKLNRHFSITTKTSNIDKFYITTALLNILENAIKYSDKNTVIDFKVESNTQLKISISDNGIGISEQNQKQLFEKFYRAENQAIHDIKGLGLGLFYSYQIIKAHQGTLTVKSKESQGTSFILSLPQQ